jgi:N utilization substance protein A
MNARLAARLTGWKVDIKSDTEFATEEAEAAFAGDGEEGDTEFTGRCGAVLSSGKRCPNAALPGSRYCGVPAHQELALRPDIQEDEEPVVAESEPELEAAAELAEPEAESIGPDSVEETAEDAALAEEEVVLDVSQPEQAPPEERPAGIPVEPLGETETETEPEAEAPAEESEPAA